MIVIYDDEGASKQSVNALAEYCRVKQDVCCLSGNDIQTTAWASDATLVIMPGGRSLPFYEKLGEVGNQRISEFVASGGAYLGLCAGAYYAASHTIFAHGLPHELHLKGALNFFAGDAIGPVFSDKKFDYDSEQGASIVDIEMALEKYAVYFNGGCYFSDSNYTVARYAENHLPAIIAFPFLKGQVVLSGVHPELGFSTIPDDEDPHHQSLRHTLILQENRRLALLERLIDFSLRP